MQAIPHSIGAVRRTAFGSTFAPAAGATGLTSSRPALFRAGGADYYQSVLLPASSPEALPPSSENAERPLYSDIKPLLASRQVQQVRILLDPKSLGALPVADMVLNNGTECKLLLPHDIKALTTILEQAGVPYTYQSTNREGIGKMLDWGAGVASDMVGPFLLLGVTGVLGMWASQKYNEFLETRRLTEELRNAHRTELKTSKYNYQDMKRYHDPYVQRYLDDFLTGVTNVVIGRGYPGLGKTHIMSALAKEATVKNPHAMVLNLDTGNILQLLKDIYGGDKAQIAKAMRILQRENGGRPVKDLLLYADEVEKLSHQTEIRDLLLKGVGNPSLSQDIPKLRMLATCNDVPAFTQDAAIASRVASFLIPPPGPKVTARILAESLHGALPGWKLPGSEALAKALHPLLKEYEGTSLRALTGELRQKLLDKLRQNSDKLASAKPAHKLDENTVKTALGVILSDYKLTPTEIAALMGRMIVARITRAYPSSKPAMQREALWKELHEPAKIHTELLRDKLTLNAKMLKTQLNRLLAKTDLNIADPAGFDSALQGLVQDLKKSRLEAVLLDPSTLSEERKTELALIQKMTDFLTEMSTTEERAQKENKTASKALTEQIRDQLAQLKVKLRNLDRHSPAGQDLQEAALLYNKMRAEFTEPEQPTFLTPKKEQAVLRRVFDFDPKKHPENADFGLVPHEAYAELFHRLHRLVKTLSRDILQGAHLPR